MVDAGLGVVVLRNGETSGASRPRCLAVLRSGTFARLPAGSRECGHVRGGAGLDERDASTMTSFADGLVVPGSPATLQTSHVLVVERRPRRSAVIDADRSGIEVVDAPFLRLPLNRDTVQSEAVA